jgi:HPt (histidine-containing phosphotransfer) domain-containing protein
MADPMDELRVRFKAEVLDRLGQIEVLLESLPTAADPSMIADAIRDHAHKLKGAAGMFGYGDFQQRASELEEESASQTAAADGATAAGAIQPVFDELTTAMRESDLAE